jgi:ribokinase
VALGYQDRGRCAARPCMPGAVRVRFASPLRGDAPFVDRERLDSAPDVVDLGSANLDVVLDVRDIPRPGETVLARGRATGPGGKGANQAVAAARSGARTVFVGAVGDDDAGALLRQELDASGVRQALRTSGHPTGTAYVVVDDRGENAIIVAPGANADLGDLDDTQRTLLRSAHVLLCQLEVPLETVSAAAEAAGGLRVLNGAPAQPLPAELTDRLDVLVVNEHEALAVLPEAVTTLQEAVRLLLERVPEVIVTLGADGALVGRRGTGTMHVPGVPARTVVDTTGAGDVFCGAYASSRSAGADSATAAAVGCAAASLSVERPGAARAAPTLAEVHERLGEVPGADRG